MPKQNPNSVQCGLIGLGRWGKNYQRLLGEMKGVALRATANHSNTEEIFSNPEIDAVFIITPPSTHYALIKSGLESNKHIFVEKPMVLNVSDAKKLETLVKKSGTVFMVGYQYLFNENISLIKKEIEKGAFGKIISVISEHVLSPSRPDVNIFWDSASHPLSVFQYLFAPQKLTAAEGEMAHDTASVQIQFENAPTLQIVASCVGQTKVRKLTIVGEKATAVLNETLEKNKLTITKNGKTSYPEIDATEPLRSELEHFIEWIQTGTTPLTDINFGYQITEWLETISNRITHQ